MIHFSFYLILSSGATLCKIKFELEGAKNLLFRFLTTHNSKFLKVEVFSVCK